MKMNLKSKRAEGSSIENSDRIQIKRVKLEMKTNLELENYKRNDDKLKQLEIIPLHYWIISTWLHH